MDKRYIVVGPLVEAAIEPERQADQERVVAALRILDAADPFFDFSFDSGSGQMIMRGMSEQHLDGIVERLREADGLYVSVGAPQAAHRECIVRAVEVAHTHKRQFGGDGEFAKVMLRFEPGEPGSTLVFENNAGSAVRLGYVPGVLKALEACRQNGVIAGYPFVELKATLVDGAYHEVDSSIHTFEIATRAAFRMLKDEKAVRLLEPVMAVEVITPDDFVGAIIGDLNARRGQVVGTDQRGDDQVVTALVPLASMLGYAVHLAAMARGRATFAMRYSHHELTPLSIGDGPDRFPPAMGMRLRA